MPSTAMALSATTMTESSAITPPEMSNVDGRGATAIYDGSTRGIRVLKHRSRRAYGQLYVSLLLLTRRFDGMPRMLPELIILGAQKAGTSSLFDYLSQHPQV